MLGSAGWSDCVKRRGVPGLREEIALGRKDNGGTEAKHLALNDLLR